MYSHSTALCLELVLGAIYLIVCLGTKHALNIFDVFCKIAYWGGGSDEMMGLHPFLPRTGFVYTKILLDALKNEPYLSML